MRPFRFGLIMTGVESRTAWTERPGGDDRRLDGGGAERRHRHRHASERATRQRVCWIREAAPDRIDALELNLFVFHARHTDDRVGAAAELAREASLDPSLVLDSPHYLLGTHAQMREQLLRLREDYGFSYFAFFDRDRSAVAPVVAELAA